VCAFIPGVNLLATSGISKFFDTLSYSLSGAENVAASVSGVGKAMSLEPSPTKKYTMGETISGGIGIVLSIAGFFAAAPAVIMVGALSLMASHVISGIGTYKEWQRAKLFKDEHRIQILQSQLKGKFASGLGAGLVAVLAAGVFFASIGFPPLGAALA